MNERQLQFRVGLLVITAALVTGGLILRFGEMRWLWEKNYVVGVHFERAPGVERGTPVRKNGILIGSVRSIAFDETRGGVNVTLEIRERFQLRKDSEPMLNRSLLGDATLEFSAGTSREFLKPGAHLEGLTPQDPLEMLGRMEAKKTATLDSFVATSEEWRKVGANLNALTDTHRGNIELIVEQAAESLHQFTQTMRTINKTVGDPQTQENIRRTVAGLPKMMNEANETIKAVRSAVVKADTALTNISEATAPLAERSGTIAVRLDSSVANLETLLKELAVFSKAINNENGSISLLARDPQLYRNLNEAASSLQLIMRNLEPAVKDLRVFLDKIARHPEKIGVGGALRPDTGLK